ncbi:stage V sporulation protein AA [Thalassobacillus hwangdonensis]|uniref:Stage V sporulation protein AA n=1 Tax=Thalassobacillus hwangdonensis TaxID=546108 RepID=A0ABW3L0B6_9BACI
MSEIVHLRLKRKVHMSSYHPVLLKDIALVSCSIDLKEKLRTLPLHYITKKDKNIVIIDGFTVIQRLNELHPGLDVQLIGPNQCIVQVEMTKRSASPLIIFGIWLLLFIGAAMAIMNFHYDVAMEAVQQKLHFMLTGEERKHPYWIQIPYSIGLGLGMILFFNHLFNKRFNEEPSPLEVEVFNYQQDLDNYIVLHENKVESNHDDDPR